MKPVVIENKIYEVRGQKVMLDIDLAELYGTETKYLKRAVRTNLKRFPQDFMFEITALEWESLRCNFSTSKRGGIRYMPFAFTEHGVTMLASILNSDKAIEMNISIVRAFIALRQFALNYKELAEQIKIVMQKQDGVDGQLNQIYDALENLLDDKTNKKIEKEMWKKRKRIGFKKTTNYGQSQNIFSSIFRNRFQQWQLCHG